MNRILQFSIFIFWGTLLYAQNLVVDGVIFSADGSTLIKFPTDKFYKEYINVRQQAENHAIEIENKVRKARENC